MKFRLVVAAVLQSQLTQPGVETFPNSPDEQVSVVPIPRLERTGPIWGFAGFILGAVLAGSAVGALGLSTSLSPPSDKPQVQAPVGNADASRVLPQRLSC